MSEQRTVEATLLAGIQACRRKEWHAGLHFLLPLVENPPVGLKLPGLAYSYTGLALARTERRHADALRLCRLGVDAEFFQPENWLNLAWAHLLSGDKIECVKALEGGLGVAPTHPGLRAMARRLGMRRPPVLSFLARSHALNVWLGRRRHERERSRAEA